MGRPRKKPLIEKAPVITKDTKTTHEVARPGLGCLESLITLVANVTGSSAVEAKNLICGITTRVDGDFASDVFTWCNHVVEVKEQIKLIEEVASGRVSVQKTDLGWVVVSNHKEGADAPFVGYAVWSQPLSIHAAHAQKSMGAVL